MVVLSLLAFVPLASAWSRSYWLGYAWTRTLIQSPADPLAFSTAQATLGRGTLFAQANAATIDDPRREPFVRRALRPGDRFEHLYPAPDPGSFNVTSHQPLFAFWGLRWGPVTYLSKGGWLPCGWWLVVPLWMPTLLAAVPPAGWAARRLRRSATRRRRIRRGLCIACGFDLRSTPVRCPECGTSPEAVDRLFDEMGRAEASNAPEPLRAVIRA